MTTAPAAAHVSLAQLAGQRIIYSYAGLAPPPQLLDLIRAGEAAGVILYATNISGPDQLRAVVDELQGANASSPTHAPLLIMTDEEGGLVQNLPSLPSLSEDQIGAGADGPALAAITGLESGLTLRAFGLNVDLAPVADVARDPFSFISALGRSYGPEPAVDAELTGASVLGEQLTGIAATAKHFPGLGSAGLLQDTDLFNVTLDVPPAQLRSVDELPFRAAIATGAKLVMLSWAIYPALDPLMPAGLSPAVIEGELRGRLDFTGVTITDELGAGALSGFGGLAQRGVLAARAGADLLLCAMPDPSQNSPAEGTAVLDGLVGALADGQLGIARAERAADRVFGLRLDP
jgi:beta-N-acetylhexosaminidase